MYADRHSSTYEGFQKFFNVWSYGNFIVLFFHSLAVLFKAAREEKQLYWKNFRFSPNIQLKVFTHYLVSGWVIWSKGHFNWFSQLTAWNYTWRHHCYDFLAYFSFLWSNTQKLNTSNGNRHGKFFKIDHREYKRSRFLNKAAEPNLKIYWRKKLRHRHFPAHFVKLLRIQFW